MVLAGAGCWVLVLWAGCARGGDRLLVRGAGRRCGCCELAVRVVETGAGAGAAGAGAGPVSWLRVRWRQVAGAGAGCRLVL